MERCDSNESDDRLNRARDKSGWLSCLRYRFIPTEGCEDTPNKDTTPSQLWTGFKERTTAHGIPHVDKGRGACKKGLWTALSVICLGVLIYQLYELTLRFIGNPVNVSVSLEHDRIITFPSVTFCNLNPIKSSLVSTEPELYNLLYGSRRKRSASSSGVLRRSRSSTLSTYETQEKVIEVLANMPSANQTALGYTRSEFIIGCRYAGSDCLDKDFATYFDPVYGNCYLYNSGWNSSNLRQSRRAGRRHGLQVTLHIHQEEYVDELAEAAGVRLVIHPQDRMPLPADEGIITNSGHATSIGITQVRIERLGYSFSDCLYVHGSNIYRNVYEEHFPVSYSSNACYRTCYQQYLIKDCGCADAQILMYGEAFDYADVDACAIDDTEQTLCKERVTNDYQNDKLDCDCPIPCEETAFTTQVSSVVWPSEINTQSVIDEFSAETENIQNSTDPAAAVKKNLLKVNIYFQNFNFQRISESAAYRNESYASDWGGVLGLWIGCSVLSLFEFLELAVDFLVLAIYKCFGLKRSRQPTDQDTTESSAVADTSHPESPPPYVTPDLLRRGGQNSSREVTLQELELHDLYYT